jgi:acyl-CoA synthetase (AMP-forming)/AMP-acid ligase II
VVPRAPVAADGAHDNLAADLLAFAGQRLARYKVPKAVVFVADLPLTGAGKVDKVRLRAEYGD